VEKELVDEGGELIPQSDFSAVVLLSEDELTSHVGIVDEKECLLLSWTIKGYLTRKPGHLLASVQFVNSLGGVWSTENFTLEVAERTTAEGAAQEIYAPPILDLLLAHSVPAGGNEGEVLTKKSGADNDAEWRPAAAGTIQGEYGLGVAYKSTVADYAFLPAAANQGDAYLVQADGLMYIWGKTGFPASGGGVPFQGPKGDTGDPGPQGKTGPQGKRGSLWHTSMADTDLQPNDMMLLPETGEVDMFFKDSFGSSGWINMGSIKGPSPVKGVDYWTAADQNEIVRSVIAATQNKVYTTSGTSTAYTITSPDFGNTYISGMKFVVSAHIQGTTSATLSINGLPAKHFARYTFSNIPVTVFLNYTLAGGNPTALMYDGVSDNFILVDFPRPDWRDLQNIPWATTTGTGQGSLMSQDAITKALDSYKAAAITAAQAYTDTAIAALKTQLGV